jgi:thioredoxin reductase (NADPH)
MDDTDVAARAVVVASGVQYRRLEIPGVEEFEGRGVYYAATELEARACVGQNVVVVGGANSAGQAALFLAQHVDQVHVLIRRDDLTGPCPAISRSGSLTMSGSASTPGQS